METMSGSGSASDISKGPAALVMEDGDVVSSGAGTIVGAAKLASNGATATNAGSSGGAAAEQTSFHQFISNTPSESTIIGEFKPNASEQDMLVLRNKIAATIMSMQEMSKKEQQQRERQLQAVAARQVLQAECFIEVTRVDKVPGKCHRTGSGLPICQSENYMTISNGCS